MNFHISSSSFAQPRWIPGRLRISNGVTLRKCVSNSDYQQRPPGMTEREDGFLVQVFLRFPPPRVCHSGRGSLRPGIHLRMSDVFTLYFTPRRHATMDSGSASDFGGCSFSMPVSVSNGPYSRRPPGMTRAEGGSRESAVMLFQISRLKFD